MPFMRNCKRVKYRLQHYADRHRVGVSSATILYQSLVNAVRVELFFRPDMRVEYRHPVR